jgi:hypothetical protein
MFWVTQLGLSVNESEARPASVSNNLLDRIARMAVVRGLQATWINALISLQRKNDPVFVTIVHTHAVMLKGAQEGEA